MTLKMDDRKMGTGPAFFGISIFHLQTSVVLNFPTTVLLGPPFSINPSLFTALPHEKQYMQVLVKFLFHRQHVYCSSLHVNASAYRIFDRDSNFLWTQWTKVTITVYVQYFSFAIRLHNNSFNLHKAAVS